MRTNFNLSPILKIIISLFLLALLVWFMRDSLGRIFSELKNANKTLFLASFIIFTFILSVLNSLRLNIILRDEKIFISLKNITQLTFIGYFFNNFMPTAVGGDIVKAYYVSKNTPLKGESFVCVFMDRFIGLFSLVLLGVLALLFNGGSVDSGIRVKLAITLILIICAIAVVISKKATSLVTRLFAVFSFRNLGTKLTELYGMVHGYRNKAHLLWKAAGLSLVAQSSFFISIFVLSLALDLDISLRTVFLVMPIVNAVSVLPSMGGLGFREMSMVVLFAPFIGKDNAFSLSLLLLGVLTAASFLGGFIYLVSPQFRFTRKGVKK
ncbi:MAG: flippase-like domain-containing protein [Candidatus Omnitrophica bacterium]|nr:flippase-like domain-containing protein [Candidatus Omnitrophota bacterium]